MIITVYNRVVLSATNRTDSKLKILLNKWACQKLGLTACVEQNTKEFGYLITDNVLSKSMTSLADLKIILCTSIKYGGSENWNLIYHALEGMDKEYNRILMYSLGCSRDATLAHTYSRLVKNYTVYSDIILNSAKDNKITKVAMFEYLYQNFDSLLSHLELVKFMEFFESISTELEFQMVILIKGAILFQKFHKI